MNEPRLCPQCRQPLGADAPDDLCPECLMKVGLGSVPEPAGTIRIGVEAVQERSLPEPGALFGGYRIVRELGRGGMGAVYEAEHLESGRSLALKVLSHRLDSMADRARFLREGRLAGSINHPNSVYVFGTEEIEDTPVITMELIPGGTLQERVQRDGPLPVGEAVDAILQVIAGLEAAQAIGILHRDIKPANCFQDVDGTVKVGDFGLSISTEARDESQITLHGQFLGTPAFCSPEQLRGEELNLRSDLYSVGVTLFFLLTGRTPFEGRNMVQLLANVIEKPAPSPRELRPEIPQELAQVVRRSLEKQPGERFPSYEEFRQALAPFCSDAPVPAPLGLRAVAGLIDVLCTSVVWTGVSLAVVGGEWFKGFASPTTWKTPAFYLLMVLGMLANLAYYAVLEGVWGRSLGKWLCRLRVVGEDRNPPGAPRALLRAVLIILVPALPLWCGHLLLPVWNIRDGGLWVQQILGISYYVMLALLFSSVRKRNGFAAWHDLLTRTRVIRRPVSQARSLLGVAAVPPPSLTGHQPKVGPFHIIESLEKSAVGEWLLGYDTRLLRKVWIHLVPPGTMPVSHSRRGLSRVGRLRWISGRRGPDQNWDVFEGLDGVPFARLLAQAQAWDRVRYWLLDLATELAAAEKDQTVPAVLALDRVWITSEGRAKLLDFPAPGTGAEQTPVEVRPPVTAANPQTFLSEVAQAALRRTAGAGDVTLAPAPLHARTFLQQLPTLPIAATVPALKALLSRVTVASRLRRAGVVMGCLAFPLLAVAGMLFGMRIFSQWQQQEPEIAELAHVLNRRMIMNLPMVRDKAHPDDRTFAIYIANRYRSVVTNTARWSGLYAVTTIGGAKRTFVEESVAGHPHPTAEEIENAERALSSVTRELPDARKAGRMQSWFPAMILVACLVLYVALPGLLVALLFRGGLVLRICGLAVVRPDGATASRGRVFWRALLVWAPVLAAPVVFNLIRPQGTVAWLVGGILGFILLALTVISVVLPGRGLPDRLAGTWLVPR